MSRYYRSPVNKRKVPFDPHNACNLYNPVCSPTPPCPPKIDCCEKQVEQEPIQWEEWAVFVPFTCTGIAGYDEDIATWYIAKAGIEFAKRARCLQRSIHLNITKNINMYELPEYPLEDIVGVVAVLDNAKRVKSGSINLRYDDAGVIRGKHFIINDWFIDYMRCTGAGKSIELVVYVVPKQGVMHFDKKLFDLYLDPISKHARKEYMVLHHPDSKILQMVAQSDNFLAECRKAQTESLRWLYNTEQQSIIVDNYKGGIW